MKRFRLKPSFCLLFAGLSAWTMPAKAEVVDDNKGEHAQRKVEEIDIKLPQVDKPHPPIKMCDGFAIQKIPEPQTEVIPKKYGEEKAVAIKLEDFKNIGEGLQIQASLRIINPTPDTVVFTGFSETSPITKVEHLVDGEWVDEKKVLRCGTGLRQCIVKPGQSAVFQVTMHAQKMPLRVGIGHKLSQGKEQHVVWSEKIER